MKTNTYIRSYRGVLWVSRILLLIAIVVFMIGSIAGNRYPGHSIFKIILLIIPIVFTVIAWLKPFSGGIVILAAILASLFSTGYFIWIEMPFMIPVLTLFLSGGIISVIAGHIIHREKSTSGESSGSSRKRRKLTWLPSAVLLVALLEPFLLYIFDILRRPDYIHWDFSTIGLIIDFYGLPVLLFIVLIAWAAPIAAGILAIIAIVPLFCLEALYIGFQGGGGSPDWLYFSAILVGGVFSIAFGCSCRNKKKSLSIN